MKHARTRIKVGETDFERDLLRSWKSEEPSGAARRQALALLVGPAVISGASTAKVAGATNAAKAVKIAASASLPPKAGTLGVGIAGKWILASVILTTAVGATVVRSSTSHKSSEKASPVSTSTRQNAPPSVASSAPMNVQRAVTNDVPTTAPPAIAPTESPMTKTATKNSAHVDPVSATPTSLTYPIASSEVASTAPELGLGEEVAAIDRVHAASASGDYAGALHLLDTYDARFPRGEMAQESAFLRIEALFQEGDAASGKLLAEHFLAANPNSTHTAQVQALINPKVEKL